MGPGPHPEQMAHSDVRLRIIHVPHVDNERKDGNKLGTGEHVKFVL